MTEPQLDKLIEEVREEIRNLLGTEEMMIDRDKLWEIEFLHINMRLIDAAVKENPEALLVLGELRERLIDRRYPLSEDYYKKKEGLDNEYESRLRELEKKAKTSELARHKYMMTLFRWIMERIRLQDEWVRGHSPLKVVASVYLGEKNEDR